MTADHVMHVEITSLTGILLKCLRCKKHGHGVGKIKLFPDVCLRCASALDLFATRNPEWLARHEEIHASAPVRALPTTHIVGNFDVVYMPEETYRQIYSDRLNAQTRTAAKE